MSTPTAAGVLLIVPGDHGVVALLPGPRDRAGLPESILFWEARVESASPEDTFRVGVIYGPSGCGKSSLAKAVLLPHLDETLVASAYIEATAEDTEAPSTSATCRPAHAAGMRKDLTSHSR